MDAAEALLSFFNFLDIKTVLTLLLLLLLPLLLFRFRSSFSSLPSSNSAPSVADDDGSSSFAAVAIATSDNFAAADAVPPQETYDVFISFRGVDTRDGFTSYLYAALCQKNISTCIDDRLEKGGEISPELLKAIEHSRISIVIFSEKYATSPRCLDELVHILNCKKVVIPVFYRVDPSDVRRQKGSYDAGLSKLEGPYGKKKVEAWRVVLTQAANLSGFHSNEFRPETKLVEAIIQDVLKKLKQALPSTDLNLQGFFGLEKPIGQIESLLCIGSKDIQVIGLWGMPGIGKTTLAGVVFHRLSRHFESHCFVENVREKSENCGQNYVRNKLCEELLKEENLNITTPFLEPFITTRLRRKKVLIVLDDVSHPRQLDFLGVWIQFGLGSRIIVTTRDKHVLACIMANEMVIQMHEVEALLRDDALRLLEFHAFRRNSPTKEYRMLSTRVVSYAHGNPLALKVLGSHLCDRSKKIWESTLNKLEVIPDKDIQKVLQISYDDLHDNEKNIFLDLACFFKGENINFVKIILDGCDFFSDVGLELLAEKCLITINNYNELCMHDLVQQMGREIVRQQSINNPERRTRLWKVDEIYHILNNDIGTEAIEGIYFNISSLRKPLHLRPTTFSRMYKLRLLNFYRSSNDVTEKHKVYVPVDLQALPDTLRYMQWEEWPSKSLPLGLPENLVALHLPHSQLEEPWDEAKLILENMGSSLNRVVSLDLRNSKSLKDPSMIIGAMKSLSYLILCGCSSVSKFPELSRNIALTVLNLSGTSISAVPESIGSLCHLKSFDLTNCRRLESLPNNFNKLKHLEELLLNCSAKFKTFPEIVELMENLVHLNLSGTAIEELPSQIDHLIGLRNLSLEGCKQLVSLPASIKQLVNLHELSLHYCDSLKCLPELPPSRLVIGASGCTSLETVFPHSTISMTDKWDLVNSSLEESDFSHCPKLDQNACNNIIAGLLPKIYRVASLARINWVDDPIDPLIKAAYPGNQFPEWIESQTEGDSLHIKLPPTFPFSRILGFVFCAHVAIKHCIENAAQVLWSYNLRTSNGWSEPYGNSSTSIYSIHLLDHVVIGYDFERSFYAFGDDIREIKVDFSIIELNGGPREEKYGNYELRKCGIKCVYSEEVEKFVASYQNIGKFIED